MMGKLHRQILLESCRLVKGNRYAVEQSPLSCWLNPIWASKLCRFLTVKDRPH